MKSIAAMMAAMGNLFAPLTAMATADRRYAILPNVSRRPRGTPRRKLITRAQRRVKHQMQKASRRINRKLNRRHPG
jgi:hypothetical protein